jgi:hypothetical protein
MDVPKFSHEQTMNGPIAGPPAAPTSFVRGAESPAESLPEPSPEFVRRTGGHQPLGRAALGGSQDKPADSAPQAAAESSPEPTTAQRPAGPPEVHTQAEQSPAPDGPKVSEQDNPKATSPVTIFIPRPDPIDVPVESGKPEPLVAPFEDETAPPTVPEGATDQSSETVAAALKAISDFVARKIISEGAAVPSQLEGRDATPAHPAQTADMPGAEPASHTEAIPQPTPPLPPPSAERIAEVTGAIGKMLSKNSLEAAQDQQLTPPLVVDAREAPTSTHADEVLAKMRGFTPDQAVDLQGRVTDALWGAAAGVVDPQTLRAAERAAREKAAQLVHDGRLRHIEGLGAAWVIRMAEEGLTAGRIEPIQNVEDED